MSGLVFGHPWRHLRIVYRVKPGDVRLDINYGGAVDSIQAFYGQYIPPALPQPDGGLPDGVRSVW